MASSSSSFSSFSALNCIGFILILLLSFDIVRAARPAAAADPMLKVCSRTTYPKTCTECIAADTGRAAYYDLKGMIRDIFFCTWSHATDALAEANYLVDNCTTNACSNKDVVAKCHDTIVDARQQFMAILGKDLNEIQSIQADLLEARAKLNDCAYQQSTGQFPQKMIDAMNTTKRLQEIGTSLCQLVPTNFVQP